MAQNNNSIEAASSFTIYENMYMSIRDIDDIATRVQLYEAIADYELYGIDPELSGIALTLWRLMEPGIAKLRANKINGSKPKAKKSPKDTDTASTSNVPTQLDTETCALQSATTETNSEPKQSETEADSKPDRSDTEADLERDGSATEANSKPDRSQLEANSKPDRSELEANSKPDRSQLEASDKWKVESGKWEVISGEDTPLTPLAGEAPPAAAQTEQAREPSIPYQAIMDSYNAKCPNLPQAKKLTDKRKRAIAARLHSGFTLEDFDHVFEIAGASKFLAGDNGRNWNADFDWLLKPDSMTKALEGKYDNGRFKPKADNRASPETDYARNDAPHRSGGGTTDWNAIERAFEPGADPQDLAYAYASGADLRDIALATGADLRDIVLAAGADPEDFGYDQYATGG